MNNQDGHGGIAGQTLSLLFFCVAGLVAIALVYCSYSISMPRGNHAAINLSGMPASVAKASTFLLPPDISIKNKMTTFQQADLETADFIVKKFYLCRFLAFVIRWRICKLPGRQ